MFSVEHWSAAVHDWVCYSAPVRAGHGRPVGVIDFSTTWDRAHAPGIDHRHRLAQIDRGDVAGAAEFYTGQLLPPRESR